MRFRRDQKISILTGAGISAESGLKTFRGTDGLWRNHRVEEVASPKAFQKDPALVWDFYKERYKKLQNVQPNKAHLALKLMEDYLKENFTLITQNVDGLHSIAGNKHLYEMHGNLRECFCMSCNYKNTLKNIDPAARVPQCPKCGDNLRPNVVWFGEFPYHLEEIKEAIKNSDYFIIIGTSGVIYPAADFLRLAKNFRVTTLGLNLEKPSNVSFIDHFYSGKAAEELPKLVNEWIGRL
ncbi:MAG: NAD-dependent deacylase [Candidatus Cloacimonetes bacterium]|nr:NAD-dependent deacylase [Candidatus Cloacimonadota bacterium]MBS3767046.1 NAD-dependent deacylase [Candidatus Cloacimonadota bacterium]